MNPHAVRLILLSGGLAFVPAIGSAQNTCVPYNGIGMWQPQITVHFTIEGPDGIEKDNIREAVRRQHVDVQFMACRQPK